MFAVCNDGKVRIINGKFELCTNGTFKNMCDFPGKVNIIIYSQTSPHSDTLIEEMVTMLDHEGILKRETGGGGKLQYYSLFFLEFTCCATTHIQVRHQEVDLTTLVCVG